MSQVDESDWVAVLPIVIPIDIDDSQRGESQLPEISLASLRYQDAQSLDGSQTEMASSSRPLATRADPGSRPLATADFDFEHYEMMDGLWFTITKDIGPGPIDIPGMPQKDLDAINHLLLRLGNRRSTARPLRDTPY